MPLTPGVLLNGRYQVEMILGEGGMGAVYRAVDTQTGKNCAVKEFRMKHLPSEADLRLQRESNPLVSTKEDIITREKALLQFRREADLLAGLDHLNLPKVTDYFEVGQDYYLVMTLIEGKNAATVLASLGGKPLPERAVLIWLRQIIDALVYCHSKGVIHRDVKPANIILTVSGNVYLVDFGIAKLDNPSKETSIGARVVTPGYSPPEQYSLGRTDVRSDVYSVGATMYAMLTAREPVEAINRLMGVEMPPPNQLNPGISAILDSVIVKATSLRPEDRFNSMLEMQLAIFDIRTRSQTLGEARKAAESSSGTTMPESTTAKRETPPSVGFSEQPRSMIIERRVSPSAETSESLFRKAPDNSSDNTTKERSGGFFQALFGKKETSPKVIAPLPRPKLDVSINENLQRLVWSPSGDFLALITNYGISIFDQYEVRPLWRNEFGWQANRRAVFSPDEALLAAGIGPDVQIWSIASGQKVGDFTIDGEFPVNDMVFQPNGPLYVAGASTTKGTVRIWDLQSRNQVMSLSQNDRLVGAVALSPDGRLIAVGWMELFDGSNPDGIIQIWDIPNQLEAGTVLTKGKVIPCLEFHAEAKLMSIGSGRDLRRKNLRTIRISSSGETFGKDHAMRVMQARFSQDGRYLASVGDDGSVKIWWLEDRSELLIEPLEHIRNASCVAFSPNGKMLAIGTNDGNLYLRNVKLR